MTRLSGMAGFKANLKANLKRLASGAYYVSRLDRAVHRGKVAILTYHRVLPRSAVEHGLVQAGMYVLDSDLDQHLRFLKQNFTIISLNELLALWGGQHWNTRERYCVITLDDGWLDNYRYAYPILRRYNLPATIFLPTDFIGTSRWFWPERLGYLLRAVDAPSWAPERREAFYQALGGTLQGEGTNKASSWETAARPDSYDRLIEACKELEAGRLERLLANLSDIVGVTVPETRVVMNWEEMREMSQHGITFGSHSCSHRLMTQLPEKEARQEATASYERLRENGANVVPVFCYPNGNYNDLVQRVVREAGYEAAASCDPGLEGAAPANVWALRRVSIHHDISESPSLFALALSGLR